jgi:hypothetical protein
MSLLVGIVVHSLEDRKATTSAKSVEGWIEAILDVTWVLNGLLVHMSLNSQ